jgi:transcriptional regulator with XRE-family HTH domain
MAGQPKTRAMLATINTHGVEALLERIANGETLKAVAESIGVSRQTLGGVLNSDDNREALRAARKAAAGGFAEETIEIAEASTALTERVDQLRIKSRHWLAERWDRETYGQQPTSVFNLSVGQLHLDALRNFQASSAEIRTIPAISENSTNLVD